MVIAQAITSPFAETLERLLGGGVLVVAAWLIIRWTFRLIGEVRAIATEDRKYAEAREKMLLDQLSAANEQLAELNAQLTSERQLRLSLEQLGLRDRRET